MCTISSTTFWPPSKFCVSHATKGSFFPSSCLATRFKQHFLAPSTTILVSLVPGLSCRVLAFCEDSARCTEFSKFVHILARTHATISHTIYLHQQPTDVSADAQHECWQASDSEGYAHTRTHTLHMRVRRDHKPQNRQDSTVQIRMHNFAVTS